MSITTVRESVVGFFTTTDGGWASGGGAVGLA